MSIAFASREINLKTVPCPHPGPSGLRIEAMLLGWACMASDGEVPHPFRCHRVPCSAGMPTSPPPCRARAPAPPPLWRAYLPGPRFLALAESNSWLVKPVGYGTEQPRLNSGFFLGPRASSFTCPCLRILIYKVREIILNSSGC